MKPKKRQKRRKGRRWWRFLLPVLLLLALGPALVAAWAWRTLQQPFKGYGEAERWLVVEPGSSARRVLEELEAQGILPSATLARLYLVYGLGDPSIQAGEYRFDRPLSTPEVLDRLIRGEVVLHPVTLVEGLTLEETATALAEAGFGELQAFRRTMASPALIADLDSEATDLEGYLFPETYRFSRKTPEAEIVRTLVQTFRRHYVEEIEPLLVPDRDRSLREVIILASIVEKEARLADERPVIAGVFMNRLRRQMPLQADPTVIYALKLRGTWDGNIRRADLQIDSPYNTYRYPGLPPGPICSPGVASLRASARPAPVPYLYFVSRNDGSHVFAETLEEHNRNVERWQKQYWRERWARERRR